ncbi:MAG: hypothetical protein CM15mV145_020 [uncultured marine virus]|nr:MAG: hypothetical protein CM15mV145_020 [uncultured marine virus]
MDLLSLFFFDIRKKCSFWDSISSKKKKLCDCFKYNFRENLLKWFAPILVFTTEEIYSLVNNNTDESIHENNFLKIPTSWKKDRF